MKTEIYTVGARGGAKCANCPAVTPQGGTIVTLDNVQHCVSCAFKAYASFDASVKSEPPPAVRPHFDKLADLYRNASK